MSYTRNRFSLNDALRLGFWTWARNLIAFTALSLVLHAPFLLWAGLLRRSDAGADAWHSFSGWNTLGLGVVNALLSAIVTYAVCMELDRRPTSFGSVIGVGLRRAAPAILVAILTSLLTFLATLLLVVPGLIVMCMLFVATPASVVERPGIIGALRRSRVLTAGSRMKIFGLAVLIFLAGLVTMMLVQGLAFGFGDDVDHLMPMAELARSLLLAPLTAAVVASTYVLLRRQRDGVDTASLAEVFS